MNKSYEIATMELGHMEKFIYLITDVDSRQAAVVDPAWEPDKIIEYASANDIQITDILLTHSHHDHINGVEEVLNKYDSKLHLLKAEADFWQADLVKPELHYGGDTISIGQCLMATSLLAIPYLFLVVDAVIYRVATPNKCLLL